MSNGVGPEPVQDTRSVTPFVSDVLNREGDLRVRPVVG